MHYWILTDRYKSLVNKWELKKKWVWTYSFSYISLNPVDKVNAICKIKHAYNEHNP
jgi:hypothetical protein